MEITPIPWPQFVAELQAIYMPPMRAKATWGKLRQVLDLAAAAGATSTADLTPVLVARIVQGRPEGQSSHTLNSLLRSLRTACSYAVSCGYARANPFSARPIRLWVRPGPPRPRKHITRDQIHRILALLAKDVEDRRGWPRWKARRLQALVAVVTYCGLRKSEATHLWTEDLDIKSRIIWIRERGKRLKTVAAGAPVPIPEALVPILVDWLRHRMDKPPIGYGSRVRAESCWLFPTISRKSCWCSGQPGAKPLDRLAAVANRAGVEGVTFQVLRRSLATHLEYHGVGPALIQRILRHTDSRTTEKWYRQADVSNLREKVAGLEF